LQWIELLPQYVLYGFYAVLAAVIGLVVLSLWRNMAPATSGLILGYYEILGKYAGGKLHKWIRGMLVDATYLFLNPSIEPKFKQRIIENIDQFLQREGNEKEKEKLRELKTAFQKGSLLGNCRIIVTRERLFTKHILIQYGYVDKPLTEYASQEDRGKFTFSSGVISKGAITGTLRTLAGDWNIPKPPIGKCKVHLFLPDLHEKGVKQRDPPDYLAKISLFAPSIVEAEELVSSLREQVRDLRRQLMQRGKEISAMAAERDAYLRLAQASGDMKGKVKPATKKVGLDEIITLGLPALIGGYFAQYAGYDWMHGALLGLAVGAYILYRRWTS